VNNKTALFLLLLSIIVVAILSLFVWNKGSNTKSTDSTATSSAQAKTPRIGLTLIATGLGSPTAIASTRITSDRRLFIVDRLGLIRIINEEGQIEKTPFLDIRGRVQAGGEMGLLGLAFHPSFKDNGYFYVNYIDKSRSTMISRFKVTSDKNAADPGSEKAILEIPQPYKNHNGGDLAFGPDGYLYIALGDGGSGGDPQNRAQNMNDLLGKILRIDVDKGDSYNVPADNPFVNQADAKAEIWSAGWRNPWRFSFDRTSGNMWIADVGQGTFEEINFEKATDGGKNYGWRCYEGSKAYLPSGCKDKSQYVFPVIEYHHTEKRCSVTGGYVYRGVQSKELTGKYFYGDYCGGQVYLASEKNGTWEAKLVASTPYQISTFGEDSQGEIYLADFKTGSIYLIEDMAN